MATTAKQTTDPVEKIEPDSDSAIAERQPIELSTLKVDIKQEVQLSVQAQQLDDIVERVMEVPKPGKQLKKFWLASIVLIALIVVYSMYSNWNVSFQANGLVEKVRKQIDSGDMIEAHVTLTRIAQVPEQMSSSQILLVAILAAVTIAVVAYTRLTEQSRGHEHATDITKDVMKAITTKNAVLNTIQSHKDHLSETVTNLEKKREELTSRIGELNSQEEKSQERIKELQTELQKTNTSLTIAKKDLALARTSYEQQSQEVRGAKERLDNERRKRGELQSQLTGKKLEAERLKTELSTEQRSAKDLKQRLQQSKSAREAAQAKLSQETAKREQEIARAQESNSSSCLVS